MTLYTVYFTVTYIHPNGYEDGEDTFVNYVRAENLEEAIALTKEHCDIGEGDCKAHSFRGEVCTGRYH